MIIINILSDAFFAAIAGVGFGAISDPPMRAFRHIAILAAVGHAIRYSLMHFGGVDIATASFIGAIAIGFGALWLGGKIYCPMTVLYIPALLPMIPGKYAYSMFFSLIMCLQTMDTPAESARYMELFLSNGIVTVTVIFLLAIGGTLPIFIFPGKAYSLTRQHKPDNSTTSK